MASAEAQVRTLQQHYTTMDGNSLAFQVLEEDRSLRALLSEAVGPLQHAFGEGRLIKIRAQYSDDDTLLKVAVQLPADFLGDPECVLRSFDDGWWTANCHRSGGALDFDYEIQAAV